jgi:cytochrome b561
MAFIQRYTRTAVVLHWLIALLITVNVILALTADYLPDDWVRPVINTHKSIGITVLGLALMRILWRLTHRPPPLPRGYPGWERIGAHVAHAALYVLIFTLPLSGWLHDSAWKDAATHPMSLFGIVPWPRIGWVMDAPPVLKEQLHDRFGALHTWAGYVLYGLFALHVLGALKHQWIDREPELQRMWPPARPS